MTKTDWTAETTDRLRTIVEFVNGRCTNEEAGRKCLGFIMQYGESWLERIDADEARDTALTDTFDAEHPINITEAPAPTAVHPIQRMEGPFAGGGIVHQTAQPAQEQPGWKAPENAIAWMTPGGDVSRSYLWCAERCRDEQRPIPLYLAALCLK